MDNNITNDDKDDIIIKPSLTNWNLDKAKMHLAYLVLIGIISILIIAILINVYQSNEFSKSLFEFCKTGLLPIVTLILGYYFSKR